MDLYDLVGRPAVQKPAERQRLNRSNAVRRHLLLRLCTLRPAARTHPPRARGKRAGQRNGGAHGSRNCAPKTEATPASARTRAQGASVCNHSATSMRACTRSCPSHGLPRRTRARDHRVSVIHLFSINVAPYATGIARVTSRPCGRPAFAHCAHAVRAPSSSHQAASAARARGRTFESRRRRRSLRANPRRIHVDSDPNQHRIRSEFRAIQLSRTLAHAPPPSPCSPWCLPIGELFLKADD